VLEGGFAVVEGNQRLAILVFEIHSASVIDEDVQISLQWW